MHSKWLDWPRVAPKMEKKADGEATKPTKPSSVGFVGAIPSESPIIRDRSPEVLSDWPAESLEAERQFGQPHAKLFPFIGRKVRTPGGPGTLLQVFADRVTVVLDSERFGCSFFPPGRVEPVVWEAHE